MVLNILPTDAKADGAQTIDSVNMSERDGQTTLKNYPVLLDIASTGAVRQSATPSSVWNRCSERSVVETSQRRTSVIIVKSENVNE